MGLNTPAIILNDAWHDIENDPKFGRNLYEASMRATRDKAAYASAGYFINAATVLPCAHADFTRVVAVGGNYISELCSSFGHVHHTPESHEKLLRAFAEKLGYRLVRKRK